MTDRRAHSPTSAERAALVGLVTGSMRRIDAEQSLEELAGLADAAGAVVVLRMLQERPKPDAATFIGSGKVTSLAAACAEADVDVVIFDNELTPGPAPAARRTSRAQGHRPYAADPRHLREAGTDARRQVAGRAGAAQVSAASARRQCDRALQAGRRHRHARSGRNEAGKRSPPYPRPHPVDSARDRSGAAAPRPAARTASETFRADGGARRLHQCR